MAYEEQIAKLTRQIVEKYAPEKIFLFGSYAKGVIRKNSDIDLCIVKDTDNIRELKRDLQLSLDVEIPVDIMVYTPASWSEHSRDCTSFAYQIQTRGVLLYGE